MPISSENLSRIESFADLAPNWDGYGASPVSPQIIEAAAEILPLFPVQPEVFPTPAGGIQMELEAGVAYLEIEFLPDGMIKIFTEKPDGEIFEDFVDIPALPKIIKMFCEEYF